jgi:hypothetical protein
MTQFKTKSRSGSRTAEPVEDCLETAFYRRGMIYVLRDCVSVGLMEAFDRPPARQRLRALIGDGKARTLIP